jgi:2-polyprenyl-3-methyl-5-hydroxy-6-metoxy-1,4-benzoquinol methylase
VSSSWCNFARVRRQQIESGADLTFNVVFRPFFLRRVLDLCPTRVLEVGAGTGHISKDIASSGVSVTAIEPSKGMYNVAKDVLSQSDVNLLNCSSFELPIGDRYEVSISHLVAHVVDDLENFLLSVSSHLHQGGYFIFSIPHPCFYNEYKGFFGGEYNYMVPMNKDVTFTITKDRENAIKGVPYYHRPISNYITTLVSTGFCIVGFDETYPNNEIQEMYGEKWKTPRYCVFTCKKL